MTYVIRVNNKVYIVSTHAAERMLLRGISEEMIIRTLENGTVSEQSHGTDLYEHQIYDEIMEETVIVQVAVDEENRVIVTVIDDTEG